MTANPQRGEITAQLDGRSWTLCLTLGALARLEAHFGVADLPELAARFSDGAFGAEDLLAILHAGLIGGGHDVAIEDVAQMRVSASATGYTQIVADLLVASFSSPGLPETTDEAVA